MDTADIHDLLLGYRSTLLFTIEKLGQTANHPQLGRPPAVVDDDIALLRDMYADVQAMLAKIEEQLR